MSRANTPFSGLTVLDFSRYLPGGYATQVLADLGATVIKVEDTGLGRLHASRLSHQGRPAFPTTSPHLVVIRSRFR